MLRSQTVLTIHNLAVEGKTVQEIAQELSISRTTVRKYLNHPEAVIRKRRPPRPSKLDPFKEQITKWVTQDYCINCPRVAQRGCSRSYPSFWRGKAGRTVPWFLKGWIIGGTGSEMS